MKQAIRDRWHLMPKTIHKNMKVIDEKKIGIVYDFIKKAKASG